MIDLKKVLTPRSLLHFGLRCIVVIIVAFLIRALLWPAVTVPSKDPSELATERTSRQLKEIEDAVKAIQGPNKPSDQN